MANSNDYKDNNSNNISHKFQKLVWSLNVLIKSILMYPENHLAIESTVKKSFKVLNTILVEVPSITLSMGKEKLVINEKSIEKYGLHTNDFCHFFRSRGIASVTIIKGISIDELRSFFNLLSKIPFRSHVENHKDIHKLLKSFNNISIREMDLRDVKFTDEEAIGVSKSHSGVSATVWQEFILNCMLPVHEQTKDSFSVEAVALYAKNSINRFLKEYKVSSAKVGVSYKKVLEEHYISQKENSIKVSGREDFFNIIGNVLPDLDDEIKEQILSSTYESISKLGEGEKLKMFLGCMHGKMLIALVEWVRTGKSNLSPTIIKLLNMLSWNDMLGDVDTWVDDKDIPWEELKELFSKNTYDKYIPEDYAEQLLNIALVHNGENGKEAFLPADSLVKALQDESVNSHISNALFALMQRPLDEQVYIDYTGNLCQLLFDLLKVGEYELLLNINDFYTNEIIKQDQGGTRKAAQSVIDRFSDDRFITIISNVFSAQKGETNEYLDELIFRSGTENLNWLIEEYLEQELFDRSSRIFKVLQRFGPEICKRAAYRLPGDNRDQTLLLLKLIYDLDDSNTIMPVRELLNSKDIDIRFEAIRTLMNCRDMAALAALKELALSKNSIIRHKAYDIVNQFFITELSSVLAETIKTVFISRSTLVNNKTVLSLLASLRDPNVLPDLERIIFSRFSFTPSNLRKTKEFLYETLSNYPQENIKELIEKGIKSRNSKIKSLCKEMMRV